jgi:hypothetical protein
MVEGCREVGWKKRHVGKIEAINQVLPAAGFLYASFLIVSGGIFLVLLRNMGYRQGG